MSKYIDTDKLKADIESIINSDQPIEYDLMEKRAYDRALSDVIDLIDSLQQERPEVELDDIIRVEFGTRAKVEGGKRYVKLDWDKFGILAYHFYALGQQSRIARKEEQK